MIEIDATFIAFVALILFFAVLWYLKVPGMIAGMLDQRSAAIAKELTEAKRLRDEAAALLKDYEAKKRAAEAEAQAIVAQAKEQAAALAVESRVQMADALARRQRQAEDRIARAEAQAEADVRAAAVEAAMATAEKILKSDLDAKGQTALVERGIKDLAKKFA